MNAQFSFFKAPITNTKPYKDITLPDAYRYIRGGFAREQTEHLRHIEDIKAARAYKAKNFHYCTFSGTFSSRSEKALIAHSGLLCIDFDHLQNAQELKEQLLQDDYFETQLLFRSPSGYGLKWIIPIDSSKVSHGAYFDAVSAYLKSRYWIATDKACRDVSRACFLPFDPDAYINPEILLNHE